MNRRTSGTRIRVARPDDGPTLASLAKELGYDVSLDEARDRLNCVFNDPNQAIWVAADADGRITGWLQAEIVRRFLWLPYVDVAGLVVTESARGQSIGRRLLATAEDWAREAGCAEVRVRSNVVRARAHGFYEHLGYAREKSQHVFVRNLTAPIPSGPESPGNLLEWIRTELRPRECDSTGFIYDDMDSQSLGGLPIIYQPFDGSRPAHWRDRGAILDFTIATGGAGKRILDFGPGDGWPALGVAKSAREVVGVEGSARRAAVCEANARRLGIANARFLHVAAGDSLPFEDGTFDGATAASAIEQTPDPRRALREIHRVLRSGGRLRMEYEALSGYRGGREQDLWLWSMNGASCRLLLFDRRIGEERVIQYGLTFAIPARELKERISPAEPLRFSQVTIAALDRLRPALIDSRVCVTRHPSGRTLAAWLKEIGFSAVLPTHSGQAAAGRAFELCEPAARPSAIEAVDRLLRPIVTIAVEAVAPLEADPMITAVK